MKKHLGILASLFLMGATVLLWTGCGRHHYSQERNIPVCCEQTCVDPCEKVHPDPCCEPLCKPLKCCFPQSNECCIDGLTVKMRNKNMCMLGDQYPLDFDVIACKDVCDVVVKANLPEGVKYMRSEPQAKVEGHTLTWSFGSMKKGECIAAHVWLECQCEGEMCACFCATAIPVRFCSLMCAKPMLTCQKCGPEEVCPGEPVEYTITVTNRGSCAADGVVVTDHIPEGLEHASGQRTISCELGTLAPCESKTVKICLKAVKLGNVCNTAVVSSCNANTTSCEFCTCICCCEAEIVKMGPKEVQIGKNADYQITVSNVGNKPMTDVVVTDCSPIGTSIVSAEGASINGRQIVWRMPELKAGEKKNFSITLTTCTPGCYTNRVSVRSCEGCCAQDEFTTRWRGRPALTVCVYPIHNPICIGDTTTYSIEVTNQGSEQDNNLRVVARFPQELTPVSASGDSPGTVNGNVVTFAPYDHFGTRQTLKYRIDARGNKSGDGRVLVEVSSDSIKNPIVEQASTIVN